MGARRDTAHPDLSASTIRVAVSGVEPKPAGEKAQRPNAKTRTVTTKRVEPVEPKRDSFDAEAAGTKAYRAAHEAYETALEAYRAGEVTEAGGNVPPKPKRAPRGKSGQRHSGSTARKAPTTDAEKLEKAGVVKKPADDLDRTEQAARRADRLDEDEERLYHQGHRPRARAPAGSP